MAKKNSGSGAGVVVLLLLAFAIKYWEALVGIGVLVLAGWLFVKLVRSWNASPADHVPYQEFSGGGRKPFHRLKQRINPRPRLIYLSHAWALR